jgi:hypothetical protein
MQLEGARTQPRVLDDRAHGTAGGQTACSGSAPLALHTPAVVGQAADGAQRSRWSLTQAVASSPEYPAALHDGSTRQKPDGIRQTSRYDDIPDQVIREARLTTYRCVLIVAGLRSSPSHDSTSENQGFLRQRRAVLTKKEQPTRES